MRVGIRVPGNKRGGGAHTYEDELFGAMLEATPPWDGWVEIPADRGLRRYQAIAARAIFGAAERLRSPASHSLGLASIPWRRARARRLDCAFDLTLHPSHPIDTSIPYGTVIWDLGHREIPIFPEMSSVWEWGRREAFYRTVIGRAAILFTGGEYLRGRICDWYGVPRERVVTVGMPAPRWPLLVKAAPPEALKSLDVVGQYLLYPAQFWTHKNHISALRTLASLRDDDRAKKLKLVFVGHDYGNLAYIRRQVQELQLTDRVVFLGFVDRSVLSTLYQNAVALLFPSHLGPDNLPPLEAMQLRCPVIAAKVPGTEEQLGSAAILVEPTNIPQIREAVLACLTDSVVRARLIGTGQEHVQRMTLARTAGIIVEAINQLRPFRESWEHGDLASGT